MPALNQKGMKMISKHGKPEWFDLSNYEQVPNLTLHDWICELIFRRGLINKLKEEEPLGLKDTFEQELLYATREHGLLKLAGITFTIEPEDDSKSPYTKWINKHYLSTAVSMLNYENLARLNMAERPNDPTCPYDVYQNKITGSPSRIIHLSVNLNAPNAVLKRDLQKLIDSYRNEFNIEDKTIASDPKIKNWIEAQVLPYLDLLIWTLEDGIDIEKDIGFTEIARWMPPSNKDQKNHPKNDTDRGEQIKKTTHKKQVESLMADGYIEKIISTLLNQPENSSYSLNNR